MKLNISNNYNELSAQNPDQPQAEIDTADIVAVRTKHRESKMTDGVEVVSHRREVFMRDGQKLLATFEHPADNIEEEQNVQEQLAVLDTLGGKPFIKVGTVSMLGTMKPHEFRGMTSNDLILSTHEADSQQVLKMRLSERIIPNGYKFHERFSGEPTDVLKGRIHHTKMYYAALEMPNGERVNTAHMDKAQFDHFPPLERAPAMGIDGPAS